jgi:gliding motility-associated-like protein
MDFFDLTSVDDIVNQGSGFNVLWFQNSDMTGPINSPSAYFSGTTTVFAVVDNGSCLSMSVPVSLEIFPTPTASPASLNACEESNGMATFDLTSLDGDVSAGIGDVEWYLDPNLTSPIPDPEEFITFSTTVYAAVVDGQCTSTPAEVDLIVDLKPLGNPAETHLCGDDNNEAVFDLTALEPNVSAGNGTITWYLEIELEDEITIPSAFLTTTTTVYAVVFDGICNSDPIPVELIVDMTPVGNPLTVPACDDGSSTAFFNLTDYDTQVSGGIGGVDWWWDSFFTDPILNPETFVTTSVVVYASIDDGMCISDAVPVSLVVQQSPEAIPYFLETCADSSGQSTFNLTSIDTIISLGMNSVVHWFEDVTGLVPINNPTSYLSSGSIVYAQVDDGVCLSEIVPVDLLIINSVSATSVSYGECDEGSGLAVFNLSSIANSVSGGSGVVTWFLDSAGTMIIALPNMFVSGDSTVYASVTAGSCVSEIVPIDLNILQSPVGVGQLLNFCGDSAGEIILDLTSLDTLVSGHTGNVTWYSDAAVIVVISNPNSFMTGDTTLYATVSNGSCASPPVQVTISVLEELTAIPQVLEFCKPQGDTLLINLTLSDIDISGGVGDVNWYLDPAGMNIIASPDSFPGVTSQTIYANVSDGICTSLLAPVDLHILDEPVANPFLINKCGDTNGQIMIDLTTVDTFISENTGVVTWFADMAQTIPISTPGNFISGDTIVYALVTNGFCVAAPVPVTLDIVDSLTANPISIQICLLDNTTATIDLTDSDFDISGGNGTVSWFTDDLGTSPVTNTTSFTTTGDTLYAMIAADGCESGLVPIPIEVESSSFPLPACQFTSIDSISIMWAGVTNDYQISYSINGTLIGSPSLTQSTTFSIGGLGQGDTLTLSVSALYNSICNAPLTNSITCITDVCPPQTISFPGLQTAYCRGIPSIHLNASPAGGQFSGQGVSGDTLYPNLVAGNSTMINYSFLDNTTGCVYDMSAPVQIFDPLSPPLVDCESETLSSVTFAWVSDNNDYGYEYTINNGPGSGTLQTANESLLINNLGEGDAVALQLWSIGSLPCGNSDTVSVTCFAKQCPQAILTITDPGILCSDGDPVQMDVDIQGLSGTPTITWSGNGIVNPSGIFNPNVIASGMGNDHSTLTVTVEESGCSYTSSIVVEVLMTPLASFEVEGTPCLDSTLHLVFNGNAFGSSQWDWDFDGADVIPLNPPIATEYSLHWNSPGNYTLSLDIDYNGCVSNSFTFPVKIDAPLALPVLSCLEEDFYSLSVSWEPIAGASSYIVSSNIGTGKLSGTTYTITNLPDDTEVTISVQAIGSTACGPTMASIDCRTIDYIPPSTYVADAFSPNGDGINDVLYISSNDQITEVTAFRIFDRWGNLVFEKLKFQPNDPQYGWDGTFSGDEMEPGVYLYWAEIKVKGDKTLTEAGDITLLK